MGQSTAEPPDPDQPGPGSVEGPPPWESSAVEDYEEYVSYPPHDLPGGEAADETAEWIATFPLPATPTARTPRRIGWWAAVLAGIAGSVVTVASLTALGVLNGDSTPESPSLTAAPPPQVVEVREIVTDGSGSFSAAAVGRKVTPSVVTIEVGAQSTAGEFTQFGVGSGVVFRSDGYIVTNHHVVTDADLMRVVFQDGSTYLARLVGSDPSTDLAVLQIDASGLASIELGTTEDLTIGDAAVAVGNPLGLAGGASLTVGVLSAFDRRVTAADAETLFGMIQTDAPITQGSSGGALVDTSGLLIGITTAIGVSSAGAEGIGFAIPVEVVARVTDELVATGAVQHAFLGVQLDDFLLDRPDGATRPGGAVITTFPDGITSAAATAGLLEGDVIVALGGLPVTTSDDVISRLRRLRVGDSVQVEVSRDGDTLTFSVVLGTRPDDL